MNKILRYLFVFWEFIGLIGVDVNMVCENEILLIVVCDLGILNVVEELIKVGVDVNLSNGEVILLIIVCDIGYLILVENLIVVGVDVNFRD